MSSSIGVPVCDTSIAVIISNLLASIIIVMLAQIFKVARKNTYGLNIQAMNFDSEYCNIILFR